MGCVYGAYDTTVNRYYGNKKWVYIYICVCASIYL